MGHLAAAGAYLIMLLAIDPGLDTGFALFMSTGRLVACGLGDPRSCLEHRISDLTTVIIEHPFVYPRGQTKDPNAIVKLAIGAGEWGGLYKQWADVEYVLPFEWKRQLPKDVHHRALLATLTPTELELFTNATKSYFAPARSPKIEARDGYLPRSKPMPQSKRHNVLDAIGLGLYQTNRYRVR